MPSHFALLQYGTLLGLTITSLVFTVIALTTAAWTTQAKYTSPDGRISDRTFQGLNYRGPFLYCPVNLDPKTRKWQNQCYSGTCFAAYLVEELWFCEQLTVGQNLLIAGAVFTGLSLLCAVPAVLISLTSVFVSQNQASNSTPERRKKWRRKVGHQANWEAVPSTFYIWRWFFRLMLCLAALTTAVGTLITAQTLLNQQRPDGNFTENGPDPTLLDHWAPSKGIIFANLGWLPTFIAVLCLPRTSGKIGSRWRHRPEDQEHDAQNDSTRSTEQVNVKNS